jgi:hypothetical protein
MKPTREVLNKLKTKIRNLKPKNGNVDDIDYIWLNNNCTRYVHTFKLIDQVN